MKREEESGLKRRLPPGGENRKIHARPKDWNEQNVWVVNYHMHFLDSVIMYHISIVCIVRVFGGSTYKSEKQVKARLLRNLGVRIDGRVFCFWEESERRLYFQGILL